MPFLKDTYHRLLAWLGAVWYQHPSRKLIVIGITGTKGKSSSVELLSAIFLEAGYKPAALSSVGVRIGQREEKNRTGNTMPGRFFIQKFLRQAVDEGCTHAIIEVTSQGISQHRHEHIAFDAAALTCLHPEHIESHGSFEKYRDSKRSFFHYVAQRSPKLNKLFFINSDSLHAPYFEDAADGGGRIVWFAREDFQREIEEKKLTVDNWFLSNFNLENAALVTSVAREFGVKEEALTRALKNFKGVPGRLEFIEVKDKPTVVIDYAHTPDSLRALLTFLRPRTKRLIVVIGSAGGGRDKWKRPHIGTIVEEFCNRIILTSDDPYNEDPLKIIAAIKSGMKNPALAETIVARKAAIQTAVTEAKKGDIVAIVGMGSQAFFYGPKGRKIPWSERGIAEEALAQ